MKVESLHENMKHQAVSPETMSRAHSASGSHFIAIAGLLVLALAAPAGGHD
jgi:hypothetical protein